MAILINAHKISKSFSGKKLFSDISFSINESEHIGLIGHNGSGKSTLLKIMAQLESIDSGTISTKKNISIAYLPQVPNLKEDKSVEELIHSDEIISKLFLADIKTSKIKTLSGGQKKKVAIGIELEKKPDLLLLDEPTNHLDVETIIWLEKFMASFNNAILTVTHDRLFLQRTCDKIIELDSRLSDGLIKADSDYATYTERKLKLLATQEKQEERLRNTLRRETQWLKQGAKARSTKQQARIQRAEILETKVSEISKRNAFKLAQIDFQEAKKSPKKLIEIKDISKSFKDKTLFSNLNLLITHKTRLGFLGKNGCGKSTLINILLKKIPPTSGEIKHADELKAIYFEQNRADLDQNVNLLKAVSPTSDYVDFKGSRMHIKGYLSRFFSNEQMDQPVHRLSGGEQAKLLIAKLMLQEANLLILDEPTNDLDIDTLNILEEVLSDFNGAVILVSHDRYFLEQVSKQIMAFDDGNILFFEGISQWENYLENKQIDKKTSIEKEIIQTSPRKKKLSFKEQQELDSMENNINALEKELAYLEKELAKDENAKNPTIVLELSNKINHTQSQIDGLFVRWAQLEEQNKAYL